jgi:hypothetical protein
MLSLPSMVSRDAGWVKGGGRGPALDPANQALTRPSARLCRANPPVTAICDVASPPATQVSVRPHLPQVAGPKPATNPAAQSGGVSCLRAGAPEWGCGATSHGELKQVFVDRSIIAIVYPSGVSGGKAGERDASDHDGADVAWLGGLAWRVRRSGTCSGSGSARRALGAWARWRVWRMGARPLGSLTPYA